MEKEGVAWGHVPRNRTRVVLLFDASAAGGGHEQHDEAQYAGHGSADHHPHGAVGRGSCEKLGDLPAW